MSIGQLQLMEAGSPFPPEMQGHWIAEEDPSMEVIISRNELTWGGKPMSYLEKMLTEGEEGLVMVELTFPDQMEGDAIILVAMPGDLLSAYNEHFAANFVKAGA
ncbi:hypothetical protein JKL49_04880 [Phenylobacterium sp. 20VBR1]|uniref:Uncharacterized protein n=1 Tax=Phenylobacterium glaciei TaxID=2803784 RepID=A0A941D0Q9_9CAUL|nr:hypothetical protein [Phenylobacterium glaciei]MBR7618716.1 hypothetical protein [Phenylobacterium glaciei]